MMAANPIRGQVPLEAASGTWTLWYTLNALCLLEEKFGLASISDLEIGETMSTRDLRTVFWAGLTEEHEDITEREAGRIFSELGSDESMKKVMQAFTLAFPEAEAAKDGARPRTAKTGAAGTGKPSSRSGASSG